MTIINITIPGNIVDCSISLTKSVIVAENIVDTSITIDGAGFFDVKFFNNVNFTGKNVEPNTNVFITGSYITSDSEHSVNWYDFPLFHESPANIFSKSLKIENSIFHYSEDYELDYAMFFSRSDVDISGEIKRFNGLNLIYATNQASVAFLSNFTVYDVNAVDLVVVKKGSSISFSQTTITSNHVNNSLFLVEDDDSQLILYEVRIDECYGKSVFDLRNSLGIPESIYVKYESMNNFEDFFICSSKGTGIKTFIDFGAGSTIDPYINGVSCTEDCDVTTFDSCDAFYEQFEDPSKKKKKKNPDDKGSKDWKSWGIPVIVISAVCFVCCTGSVAFLGFVTVCSSIAFYSVFQKIQEDRLMGKSGYENVEGSIQNDESSTGKRKKGFEDVEKIMAPPLFF